MLKKDLGPKRGYVTGYWRKMHNEELHYLQFSPNDICDQIKADEIFLAYGTYVEEEICVQDFGEEN
jgi:hypothetical protein